MAQLHSGLSGGGDVVLWGKWGVASPNLPLWGRVRGAGAGKRAWATSDLPLRAWKFGHGGGWQY